MSNNVSMQLLQDGPRNVLVKFEGVLDTSDLAATGTIGTAGVTTTGSATVTLTAGALVPVVGQYVTAAGGTGTGFPAGAYITVVNSATSITLNAPVTTGGTGWTITGTAGAIVVVDPVVLSQLDYAQGRNAAKLAIKKITYNVEDLLSINLFWEATTNVRIEEIVGRGKMEFFKGQPLQNNAGSGITGKIVATSQGWAASGVLSFSLIIEMVKQ